MSLADYVDGLINDPNVGTPGWFPTGWFNTKKGPVHVEVFPQPDDAEHTTALCGNTIEGALGSGPARVMLRRLPGCQNCEKAVPE